LKPRNRDEIRSLFPYARLREAREVTEIPEDVLRDRDDRLRKGHATLTAELMGDPIPGRSALDMRKQF
jgi:hypothetical protein